MGKTWKSLDMDMKDASGMGMYRTKSLPTRTLGFGFHLSFCPQLWSLILNVCLLDGFMCECMLLDLHVSVSVSMSDCDHA